MRTPLLAIAFVRAERILLLEEIIQREHFGWHF